MLPLIRHLGEMASLYDQGRHCVITPQQSVPARYLDPKAKNRSRLFYKLAELQAADRDPTALPLLTDEHGFLTESVGANIFVAHDGVIHTPKPHDMLRGVSRQTCMELVAKLGIEVLEADISPYDLRVADEAWLTSTRFCMLPVARFEFAPVGNGKPGPIYTRLVGLGGRRYSRPGGGVRAPLGAVRADEGAEYQAPSSRGTYYQYSSGQGGI